MEENRINKVDRISQLPEFIVHHILSFLEPEYTGELVRTSVLSKKWFALTASFPILDFHMDKFDTAIKLPPAPYDFLEHRRVVRDKFYEYVAYTMSRFCKQNISAHKFNLITVLYESTDIDIDNFDKWVRCILEKGVRKLVLDIQHRSLVRAAKPIPMYRLPNILLSASSLTTLKITHCELPKSLTFDAVKFKSLKKLSLDSLSISEEAMKHMIAGSPLLEKLTILNCHGFKRFCVHGLPHLQTVRLDYTQELEIIKIDASNLGLLCLIDLGRRGVPSVNFASCKKLTTLYFRGCLDQTSNRFAYFLSNFPFIERLTLDISNPCKYLKFSSQSLREFVLSPKGDLEGIEMDTPNLLSFRYSGRSHTIHFSLANSSGQSKTCMEYDPSGFISALWFEKMRRILDKKNGLKVSTLYIHLDSMDVDDLKVIRSSPFEVENIELSLGTISELSVYQSVVDAVFMCCHPRTLTVTLWLSFMKVEERGHVVKVAYEKLLQQEDEGQANIQIVLSSAFEKHFSNLDSLLTELLCKPVGASVTFTKEQVFQVARKCISQTYAESGNA